MTNEEFWKKFNGGAVKWRTARKDHHCNGEWIENGSKVRCSKTIKSGEKYLDTGESLDGPFTTMRECSECANRECEVKA